MDNLFASHIPIRNRSECASKNTINVISNKELVRGECYVNKHNTVHFGNYSCGMRYE